jgi:hypothetical protein
LKFLSNVVAEGLDYIHFRFHSNQPLKVSKKIIFTI